MIFFDEKTLENIQNLDLPEILREEGYEVVSLCRGWLCPELRVFVTEHRWFSLDGSERGEPFSFLLQVLKKDLKQVMEVYGKRT